MAHGAPPCCLATLEKFLVGCNVLPMTAYGRVQARSVNPSLKVSLVRGGSSGGGGSSDDGGEFLDAAAAVFKSVPSQCTA